MDTTGKKRIKKSTVSSQYLCILPASLSSPSATHHKSDLCLGVYSKGSGAGNVITHVYGAPTVARPVTIKTTQVKQLVSAPYKHHLHSKDPILIMNNITT